MPRAFLKNLRLPRSPPRLHPLSSNHHFHTTFPRRANISLSLSEDWDKSASRNDSRDVIKEQKFCEIRSFLSMTASTHDHVWGMYVDLIHLYDIEDIPLDIHQGVLRKCTIPAPKMRMMKAKLRASGRKVREDHPHETRFQTIIRNIRSAGHEPTLEDYHVVLEHFAAVGHVESSLLVFQEISKAGLLKAPKTYGLCLQAICHYLTLPCWHRRRPQVGAEMTRVCTALLEDMAKTKVPVSSVNVDLVVRILKETQDMEGFSRLMKIAYGIDLSYPDRPPLEQYDQPADSGLDLIAKNLSMPLPFTTAALNTTIDMLGRLGDVSKLVQTFEVLTTPLPQSIPSSAEFEEDDDDDYSYSSPVLSSYPLPHAEPNTTTYRLLLKWISKAGHAVLARHYLLQAMVSDAEKSQQLIIDAGRKPSSQILAPSFTVDRNLILPVFAIANRNKSVELMRWVSYRLRRVLRRKRGSLRNLEMRQQLWQAASEAAHLATQNISQTTAEGEDIHNLQESAPSDSAFQTSLDTSSTSALEKSKDALPTDAERTGPSDSQEPTSFDPSFQTFFSPSSSSSSDTAGRRTLIPPMPYFDIDLDAPTLRSPPPPKLFDINLHLSILRRDIESLEEYDKHVIDVLGRTIQRIKERLGRRVWKGKDVYLQGDHRRTPISREAWRSMVKFRLMKAAAQSSSGSGWIAATRGLGPTHVKHANDPPHPTSSKENA